MIISAPAINESETFLRKLDKVVIFIDGAIEVLIELRKEFLG
jgi:hypothetical protein